MRDESSSLPDSDDASESLELDPESDPDSEEELSEDARPPQ